MKGELICIDPGLRHCGVALFNVNGELIRAKLIKNTEKKLRGPEAHRQMAQAVARYVERWEGTQLILEYPRVYPNHSNKRAEDPNDLLELAGVDAAIACILRTLYDEPLAAKHYFPSEWKGQVPKAIMTQRILGRLTDEEKFEMESQDHNTIDAIGLGLYFLNRL